MYQFIRDRINKDVGTTELIILFRYGQFSLDINMLILNSIIQIIINRWTCLVSLTFLLDFEVDNFWRNGW